MTTMDQTMKDQLKKDYPHFQWDRLEEINRALNWELHFGPLEPGYWVAIEPLDHYEWHGGAQALTDIQEMMNNLPVTLFYDLDFGEFAGETHPYNEDHNWEEKKRIADKMFNLELDVQIANKKYSQFR